MAGKSVFLEEAVLNGTYRNTGIFAQTGSVYVGLKTADPTDAGTGGTEPAVGTAGYARAVISRATGSWSTPAGSPRAISNAAIVSFPESTGAWASSAALTHFEIRDAATGGNLLHHGALGTARTVNAAGITVSFAAGALQISED